MTTEIDLKALEAFAMTATPGPWVDYGWAIIDQKPYRGRSLFSLDDERCNDNRRFICEANPSVVLELIRLLRQAEAEFDWLERNFNTCTVYINGQHPWRPNHKVTSLAGPTFRDAVRNAIAGDPGACPDQLTLFAERVRKEEREACAKICDKWAIENKTYEGEELAANNCARIIRERL